MCKTLVLENETMRHIHMNVYHRQLNLQTSMMQKSRKTVECKRMRRHGIPMRVGCRQLRLQTFYNAGNEKGRKPAYRVYG